MFKFAKLISPQYLFEINRVILTRSDKVFFVIGSIALVLAIVLKIAEVYALNPIDKHLRNRLFNLFLTVGILEVLWFGARYQNVKFFGTHFLALLFLLIGIVWFVNILVSVIRHYKTDKTAWEKEQIKQKYLSK